MYFRSFEFFANLSTFDWNIYKFSFTIRKRIKMFKIQNIMPILLARERNLYPASKNEDVISSSPVIYDFTSKKSYVRILKRAYIWSLTTSAKFTSMVKTCSIISGAKVKAINGNTLEFILRSMMWLANSIINTIIAKALIVETTVSSYS